MPLILHAADVVCPMWSPPLADGGVLVDGGQVQSVGQAADLSASADRVVRHRGVLLPGLVDGHGRVEHADAGALARPGPYHLWMQAVGDLTASWDRQRWSRSAHRGVQRLLRAGVTAAGDLVLQGPGVPALSRAGVVGDSWVDVDLIADADRDVVIAALDRTLGLPARGRRVGIALAGAHRLSYKSLAALGALAAERGAPVHVVAGSCAEELAAVAHAEGPFAVSARAAGVVLEPQGDSPVAALDRVGLLRPGTSVGRGTCLTLSDATLLAERGVPVVLTVRSDELLETGAAPLEYYARTEVPLALGSGGAAATPTVDLLAEAAAWTGLARRRGLDQWPTPEGLRPLPEAAVRLATIDGARALGWGDQAGALVAGRRADFVVVDVEADPGTVYDAVIADGAGRQVLTVVAGVRRARRTTADKRWPPIADHLYEER